MNENLFCLDERLTFCPNNRAFVDNKDCENCFPVPDCSLVYDNYIDQFEFYLYKNSDHYAYKRLLWEANHVRASETMGSMRLINRHLIHTYFGVVLATDDEMIKVISKVSFWHYYYIYGAWVAFIKEIISGMEFSESTYKLINKLSTVLCGDFTDRKPYMTGRQYLKYLKQIKNKGRYNG